MGILNKVLIGTLGIVAIIASIPKFMEYNMELNCLYESFVERNRIETFLKMDSIRINNRLIFDIETLYDKINAMRDDEYKLERENFNNIYMDANRITKFSLDMLDISNLQDTTYKLHKKKELLERIFGYDIEIETQNEKQNDILLDDNYYPNIDIMKIFREDIMKNNINIDDKSKLDGKQYLNDFQEFMFSKCMKKN